MIFFLLFFQIVLIYCQDNNVPEYDSIVIGNLRKREQIPLYRNYRRWDHDNLNYRRTRDIREDVNYYDRRYEHNEANMPSLKEREQIPLIVLNRRRNDFDIDSYRRKFNHYDDVEIDTRTEMPDVRKDDIFKEEPQEDLERLQRELKWFTVSEDN